MDGYPASGKRVLAYTLRWKSGIANASDAEHYDLNLKGVEGTLFRDGRPMADYSADEGTAVRATNILTLRGNVKVTAVDSKSKVKGSSVICDQMLYNTTDEIVKTTGHVTLLGKAFTLGPFKEIWCSSDLSEVSTPDEYVPVRHNQPSGLLP